MENIPAVQNQSAINSAEFVMLKIPTAVVGVYDIYTFSSAYRDETIDGQVYSAMGGLLAVGAQQRDLRVTSAATSISLSGIGSENIYLVLAKQVKGSELKLYRGFYDDTYVLTSTALRFTGIVTSYVITEERKDQMDNFTVTLNATSLKDMLTNRIVGRKTNPSSWQVYSPTDTSMNRIYSLANQKFDFGQPVSTTTVNSSGSSLDESAPAVIDQANGGGP
jgi:hypothetical protein